MARPKRPSRLHSAMSTLASILEWLLFISEPVWNALASAWRRLGLKLGQSDGTDRQAAAKKPRAKRRSKGAAGGTTAAAAAAGSKAAAGTSAGAKGAAPAQWPTDSESSEEEEERAEPVSMPNEPAPAGWNFNEWEAVNPKQRAKRLAAPLAPTGGPRISTAAAAKKGGKAATAAERSKAPVAVCERPDCGGAVGRGFAKCGR